MSEPKITVEISPKGAIVRTIDWPQGWDQDTCDQWWENYTGKNKTTDDLMREFVKVRPDHFRVNDPRKKQYGTQEG